MRTIRHRTWRQTCRAQHGFTTFTRTAQPSFSSLQNSGNCTTSKRQPTQTGTVPRSRRPRVCEASGRLRRRCSWKAEPMLQSAASEARPKLRGQDPGTIIFSHGHVPQIVVPISLAKWDESSECNLDYAFPSPGLRGQFLPMFCRQGRAKIIVLENR
jgi:hypothetical protein